MAAYQPPPGDVVEILCGLCDSKVQVIVGVMPDRYVSYVLCKDCLNTIHAENWIMRYFRQVREQTGDI